jgi:hypothetical protein
MRMRCGQALIGKTTGSAQLLADACCRNEQNKTGRLCEPAGAL